MIKWFWALLGRYLGRNLAFTPKSIILDQMNEPRPLPLGAKEFEEWSYRIISGACITGATVESQQFALATQIVNLKPTDDHCSDAYFVKTLRKSAANQVAHSKMETLRNAAKKRLTEQEETEKKAKVQEAINSGEVTPIHPKGASDVQVLGN